MNLLLVLATSLLAGTAMAEPAPTASITRTEVVLTDDELEALTDYRNKHVALTADELAFLTEYRKTQAAPQVEENKPKTGWAKVWDFVGDWWFLILVVVWVGMPCLGWIYEKWRDWRLDRAFDRRIAAEEAEEAASIAADEGRDWTSATNEATQREDEDANR